MSEIWTDTYQRMSHVTGPGCVLVSLRFGKTPEKGPWLSTRGEVGTIIEPTFNLDSYVNEAIQGVQDANQKYGGKLEIKKIQIVPDDFPREGQVRYCAFKLAERELTRDRTSASSQ